MRHANWWRRLFPWLSWRGEPRGRPRDRATRPRVEQLEDRRLLSGATHLAFVQGPTDTTAGHIISPPVTVAVEDQFNHLVTTGTDNVTLAIQNNPGGGALHGTPTVATQNGVTTFSDLSIDQPGTGYTLVARVPSLLPVMGLSVGTASGELVVRSFQESAT